MRHIFIVNPAAGKGRGFSRRLEEIKEFALRKGLDHKIYVTEGPGRATDFVASQCLEGGAVRFYACGGDGTLREVASGAAGCSGAEVAYYPCGTGNDFMRNFQEEKSFKKLDALVEEMADAGIDPGKIYQRIETSFLERVRHKEEGNL